METLNIAILLFLIICAIDTNLIKIRTKYHHIEFDSKINNSDSNTNEISHSSEYILKGDGKENYQNTLMSIETMYLFMLL